MFNTIQLVKSTQTPLYIQLSNGLSKFIKNGQLPSGTKLPSIRSLAKELKINRDTVVSAYKVLEHQGLTYGQTGRGTYVSPLPSTTPIKPPISQPFSLDHKDLINFSSTSLASHYYPIKIFEEIAGHVLSTQEWSCFHDYDGSKYKLLLQEVCNFFLYHSIFCTPKQVRLTHSLSQLIDSLPKFTNKPGVCIESPCKDMSILKEYGFEFFEVPLNNDGLDLDILEDYLKTGKIQYILVTPYLQNPTGICYSSENKNKLLSLATAYNVYIIENEIYGDLLPEGIPYLPIYSESPGNKVIYIKHFSQLYLPNLHYYFVILPNSLVNINMRPHPYNFTDTLFHHYLHNKMWQETKLLLTNDYNKKYTRLCYLIDLYLSPYFSYSCAYGGIYIWLTLKVTHITIKDLCNLLVANYILVSPASLFYTHKSIPSSIRLSISKTNMLKIEKGIIIMASILFDSILSDSEFK